MLNEKAVGLADGVTQVSQTLPSVPRSAAALGWSEVCRVTESEVPHDGWQYRLAKRSFDILVSVLLLAPALALAALLLLLANRWLNPGPLFFKQERMGRGCSPFRAWKFRSMTVADTIDRGAFDTLDVHRITPLGRVLRRTRVDELPQVINVLRGEMSLIGPRPDYFPHALVYLERSRGYRERHAVLPGISGYAQVEVGYVQGADTLRDKVAADLYYIRHRSFQLDLWIAWRTLTVVLSRQGS